MNDLQDLFDSLIAPTASGSDTRFSVVRVDTDVRHLIGKDQGGLPAILIDSSHDPNATAALLRVELQNLSVQPDIQCDVLFPDATHATGEYTLIRCSGDDELQRLFLRLVTALLGQSRTGTDRAGLAQLIYKLVDLFRALHHPPRKSVQGLWAELFLIARASDPVALLEAWHADPAELYDFSSGAQKIEVKSSSHRSRVHSFALNQLYPPAGTVGVIVSLITERAGGGVSIDDLVREISAACTNRPELQLKLQTIVTDTLGSDWRLAAVTRFDTAQAAASCRMYRHDQVPRIDINHVPESVANVRFDASLRDVASLDEAGVIALAGLAAQARLRPR